MPYFNLSGDDYMRNIFAGFAHLQQEQELVDLTLAVDGHLVKVHKNIIAVASPYIKDILKKSPSDNLVIYLNNVKNTDLSYLLEYIYQGEVNIPEDNLESFIHLAKSLHITGIDKLTTTKEIKEQEPQTTESELHNVQLHKQPIKRLQLNTSHQESNSSFPVATCVSIDTDHNYQTQPFSEGIDLNEACVHSIASTESAVSVADTICNNSDENCIDNVNNEEEAIAMEDGGTYAILTNSKVEENSVPRYSIDERNDCPANVFIAANVSQIDNNMDIIENAVANTNEEATDIPTNSIKIPSRLLEIANDNNIPLNSIALTRDNEIPTDFHIIIQKPSGSEDKSKPYSVTLKPLDCLEKSSEEPPPDLGGNFQFDKESVDALKIISQYSVTERGCIQIIVSRYIYNSHHEARGGRKHRWRCSDYRKQKCPAYIDSLDNRIVLRKGLHNHGYHDNKIYKKHEKGQIYHSLKQAENVRQKPSIQTVDPDCEDIEQFIDMKYAKPK